MSAMESFFDKVFSSMLFGVSNRRRKSLDKLREKRNSRLEEVYGLSAKRASFEKHPFDGQQVAKKAEIID